MTAADYKFSIEMRRAAIIGHYAQSRSLRKTADEFSISTQAVHRIVKRWVPEIMQPAHTNNGERRELRVGQDARVNYPGYAAHGQVVQIREFWKLDLPQLGRRADMVKVRSAEGLEMNLAPDQLVPA